jgi:hypothetical protein
MEGPDSPLLPRPTAFINRPAACKDNKGLQVITLAEVRETISQSFFPK